MFSLAALHSKQFYEDEGVSDFFHAVAANVELRSKVAIIKALAFGRGHQPAIFNRLEPVLNEISVELRNKRNRFVHDTWVVLEENLILRHERGTKLPRSPGTGERTLALTTSERFTSISDIQAVATRVEQVRIDLIEIEEALEELYRQKYPDEESQ